MLIHLELLLLWKNWSNPGAGQVSVPRMSTDLADSIFESDVPTSHLVTAAMGFAIMVMTIWPVLAMMLLEIGVNGVEPEVDVLSGISNDSGNLFIR